jgi:prephenate dehydrogenase
MKSLAIVGFGLIGGSIALAIRRNQPDVRIVAIDTQAVIDDALRRNLADAGGSDLALAEGSDLIVLAAPVRQNNDLLRTIADHVGGEALVTDVGSTKAATVDAARSLPSRIRFVGGHPLAGAATGGVGVAHRDLFQGRPWILTPLPEGDPQATRRDDLERMEAFVAKVGAVPCRLTAAEHDELMAYVSHLPQVAVSALMHVVGERVGVHGLPLAGNGLRDSTRLASSPAGTWRDIAATNAPAITAAIDDLIGTLERLKHDLAAGEELTRVFDSAARWKRGLD